MSVIDWNVYSRSHPEWFQADGIHLLSPGSRAMAGLIHDKLVAAGVAAQPVRVKTTALPTSAAAWRTARASPPRAGVGPYTWSLTGRLPAGLHLRGSGVISGAPRATKRGVYTVVVRVKDAIGQTVRESSCCGCADRRVLFPTVTFALFFLIVLPVSWALMPYQRAWQVWILLASYVFYGWWDWRFVFLLAGSTSSTTCWRSRSIAASASPRARRC